jgi:hypothetical protein
MSCEQFGFSFFDDYFDVIIDVINDIILIIIQKFARKLLAKVNSPRLNGFNKHPYEYSNAFIVASKRTNATIISPKIGNYQGVNIRVSKIQNFPFIQKAPVIPINLDSLISAITGIASPIIKEKIQRNETVIKLLKQFNLDPEHPPADFSGVYAYALVEYGVGKPSHSSNFSGEKK